MVNPALLEEYAPSLFPHAAPEGMRYANPDRLVAAHHYLCRRAARKFLRSGLERCDLEQVAALGLIKASRRYDPAAATPFEAYAWLTVIGELMHYVRDHERLVRLPRRLRALEPRYHQAHEACCGRYGREPSDAELAAEMHVPARAIADLRHLQACATIVPLDDPTARLLPAQNEMVLEDQFLVAAAFAGLDAVQRRVVAGVYLLGLTHPELGRALGLSTRQVSRVRRVALSRMQKAWAS